MRSLALVVLSFLSSSCVVHVHVHEASEASAVESRAASRSSSDASESRSDRVRGTVFDANGQPVVARVALVNSTGSTSRNTDSAGRFDLELNGHGQLVLHASTSDGRVAVHPVDAGDEGRRLLLQPGGTLTIEIAGAPNIRCAVFQGDVRLEDFTLYSGRPAQVVVPPGATRVRLYDSRGVRVERQLTIAIGDTTHVKFDVGA